MKELISNYHKDDPRAICAIKIHLMKAYDSIDWTFLLDIMEAMEFLQLYIQWIKHCYHLQGFLLS